MSGQIRDFICGDLSGGLNCGVMPHRSSGKEKREGGGGVCACRLQVSVVAPLASRVENVNMAGKRARIVRQALGRTDRQQGLSTSRRVMDGLCSSRIAVLCSRAYRRRRACQTFAKSDCEVSSSHRQQRISFEMVGAWDWLGGLALHPRSPTVCTQAAPAGLDGRAMRRSRVPPIPPSNLRLAVRNHLASIRSSRVAEGQTIHHQQRAPWTTPTTSPTTTICWPLDHSNPAAIRDPTHIRPSSNIIRSRPCPAILPGRRSPSTQWTTTCLTNITTTCTTPRSTWRPPPVSNSPKRRSNRIVAQIVATMAIRQCRSRPRDSI